MYLKSDDPHQMVMIVCECFFILLYHYFHMMKSLCILAKVSHTTHNSLLVLILLYKYNVIWPLQGKHVVM